MSAQLRVTAMRVVEVEGLGEEIRPCADKEAEHFAIEEQQPKGDWLVLSDHHTTRWAAERDAADRLMRDEEDNLLAALEAVLNNSDDKPGQAQRWAEASRAVAKARGSK